MSLYEDSSNTFANATSYLEVRDRVVSAYENLLGYVDANSMNASEDRINYWVDRLNSRLSVEDFGGQFLKEAEASPGKFVNSRDFKKNQEAVDTLRDDYNRDPDSTLNEIARLASYDVKALVVENVGSDHIEKVTNALIELGPESMTVDQADVDFDNPETFRKATREAAGEYDVINWSFGGENRDGSNYMYDHSARDAFKEGSAVTVAAGNSGRFDLLETQRSPFDFTAGAMKTFDFNADNLVDGRATKDAEWEVAWFTNQNPQFVDFYTYGDYGTSFAAPRLGSYISLIREDNPNASLSSIRTILEKNSDYQEIDTEEGSWFIQILDPYDLENNTVRDGRTGYKTQIFSDAAPESEYDFNFIFDDTINTRVRTEGLYEVYLNRNPDPDGLDWWVNEIEENDLNFENLENWFTIVDEEESLPEDNEYTVPLIEKVQGLYHVHLGRESTDEEVLNHIDYIGETGISWNSFIDEWKDDTLYV